METRISRETVDRMDREYRARFGSNAVSEALPFAISKDGPDASEDVEALRRKLAADRLYYSDDRNEADESD